MTTYYVDSNSTGSGDGTTTATSGVNAAFKTITEVNAKALSPGDSMLFSRGQTWNGTTLTPNGSGTSGSRIVYGAYGTGVLPTITVTGSWAVCVDLNGPDYITIEYLKFTGGGGSGGISSETAVYIRATSTNTIVQYCEVTNNGSLAVLFSQNNLITRNYIHDMIMVWNTVGGDDDFGANGVRVQAANNEISFNYAVNLRAASYDYGYDGGFLETFGNADNVNCHHNIVKNSDGFGEIGWGGSTVSNGKIWANISWNNYGRFLTIQNSSTTISNMEIYGNTIVETSTSANSLIWFQATPSTNTVIFKNNYVWAPTVNNVTSANFTPHTYNKYKLATTTFGGGGSLDGTEAWIADAGFTDVTNGDFTLAYGSGAIDAGTNLGSTFDTAFNPSITVTDPETYSTLDQDSYGSSWEMGAYVYGASGTPRPSRYWLIS